MNPQRKPDGTSTDFAQLAQLCNDILETAIARGFLATPKNVARHLRWWQLWYDGKMSGGYLAGRTGVKYKGQYPPARWNKEER